MSDGNNSPGEPSQGDRRGNDRRGNERRHRDRRLPLPWWRRPWALVSLGAVGMLFVVGLATVGRGSDRSTPRTDEALLRDTAPARPAVAHVPARPDVVEDASTAAAFERLNAEGEAAVGRWVKVELFCNSISSITVRNVEHIHPSLEAHIDPTARKVPVAECKWGAERGVRRDDLLLVVPPTLADEFTQYPLAQDGFVQRRRVHGEIEWLGPTDALALRPTGVLRELQ
jgi:hypothetical protein